MTAPGSGEQIVGEHNHVTRDIKPVGQCPACDDYWRTNWGYPSPTVRTDAIEADEFDGCLMEALSRPTAAQDGATGARGGEGVVGRSQGVRGVDLRCPFCGDGLWIDTEYVGGFGNSERTPVSIECDSSKCGAAWETNGDLREMPWSER